MMMLRASCMAIRCMSGKAAVPRVCVVGSGPAGFYVTQHLVKNNEQLEVDIYERLPVPFGLVRYGVAPDHPEVKNVINTFTKTAQHPRVKFCGNVSLGEDLTLRDLKDAYHAVVLTYGAERDRELGLAGESLVNVVSARRFVGWYNGLPADRDLMPLLDTDTAVVLGQGNVAIDVARILLTHIDVLKKTDITAHALSMLAASRVQRVVLVGRRGPLQVAFTIKELREMTRLHGVTTEFIPGQMDGVQIYIDKLKRPRRRLTELLLQTSAATFPQQNDKSFQLMFLRTPLSFQGEQRVSGVQLAVNTLQGDNPEIQTAVATDTRETLSCGLALRSIGYKSIAADPEVPFDSSRGVVIQEPGLYAAGWVATGPVGVILSTMSNAFEVANTVNKDLSSGAVDCTNSKPGSVYILQLLRSRGVPTVDFAGWERIDKKEIERGNAVGKPREKVVDIAEMLEIGAV
ncbi:NADPH:adrenodoxin oxidoreductase, mitochondrial [Homalodisca vitripennis]|uniref:NADPH:adrenodoxin oxidoreductase, mitochondrial n=1 Tax=Homalodisca vitripennis TaxID=197043 RepID=UPI001EEC2849|nr:NADPH:adrenodoxin oxidoreductase, mitochondrial [Homalodisca vitripennis]XP_046661054.1 NADPH:adrenodoxin oxidoreductase, mitochondrial [Homalodisca vitripennis]XP_046661055.1 NADPH:adrenodoxin oxidoreductase, mitochondrial [Homalodisca vitripennis]